MEDLLQSQIKESCKLALPNGLTELMTDISREVLRAQPENLLQFITEYLSSLLVTRENLYIATQVCGTVCECCCRPELEDELRGLGLDEENAREAAGIIEEYFGKGNVKEEDLVLKLIKKTALNEDNLPEVLAAIRSAFLRHQINRTHTDIESPPDSDDDQTERAVKHTLALYKKTDPGYHAYSLMATKIQAAYRAYRVKRLVNSHDKGLGGSKSLERSRVRFHTLADEIAVGELESETEPVDLQNVPSGRLSEPTMRRLSSTSLAGSYINLPEHRPYSIQDVISYEESEEEKPEKEHTNYFYTREESPEEELRQDGEGEISVSTSDKRIPFYTYPVDELIGESESESMDESYDNDVIDEYIVEEVAQIEEEVKEDIAEVQIEEVKEEIAEAQKEEQVKEDIAEEIDISRKESDEKCMKEESETEKYEEIQENFKIEDE